MGFQNTTNTLLLKKNALAQGKFGCIWRKSNLYKGRSSRQQAARLWLVHRLESSIHGEKLEILKRIVSSQQQFICSFRCSKTIEDFSHFDRSIKEMATLSFYRLMWLQHAKGIRLDRSMVRSLQVRSLHTEVRSLHSKVTSLHT